MRKSVELGQITEVAHGVENHNLPLKKPKVDYAQFSSVAHLGLTPTQYTQLPSIVSNSMKESDSPTFAKNCDHTQLPHSPGDRPMLSSKPRWMKDCVLDVMRKNSIGYHGKNKGL